MLLRVLIGANNATLAHNQVIGVMLCPSSPLPQLWNAGNSQVTMPSYGGVAGSFTNTASTAAGDPIDDRLRPCCDCCGGGALNGRVSGSGVLVVNKSVRLGDITDGSSNQMILVEGSDWAYVDPFNRTGRNRVDHGYPHGWPMGYASGSIIVDRSITSNSQRTFNLTTIRYPINMRTYDAPGVNENHGANNPILSAHPTGAQVGLADGSVRFLPDSMSIITLKRLAIRDDANPVQLNK